MKKKIKVPLPSSKNAHGTGGTVFDGYVISPNGGAIASPLYVYRESYVKPIFSIEDRCQLTHAPMRQTPLASPKTTSIYNQTSVDINMVCQRWGQKKQREARHCLPQETEINTAMASRNKHRGGVCTMVGQDWDFTIIRSTSKISPRTVSAC
uniref:Uncharacterized protein n=1 Tax=Caenorhabditis japonica TaxID=281687 RepID=A0A8R1IPV3_CAEJA